MSKLSHEPMLEMFIFESVQLLEQLEQIIIASEKTKAYVSADINEIFRIMHTIKGSSAMMMYDNISTLAHSMEDLFYFIREKTPSAVDFSELTDLILKGADFIKTELAEIEEGCYSNSDCGLIIDETREFLADLKKKNPSLKYSSELVEETIPFEKQKYYISSGSICDNSSPKVFKAVVHFEDDCKMENVRAYNIIHKIKDMVNDLQYFPSDIIEDEATDEITDEIIRKDGFIIIFRTDYSMDIVQEILMQTVFLKNLTLEELEDTDENIQIEEQQKITLENTAPSVMKAASAEHDPETQSRSLNQSVISVNILKLDKLMDLVGEMVIAEAMVIQNPDLQGMKLSNFQKAARQLHKITGELQDTVMSIRMVPLAATFHKMHRIVRDMSKKLGKEIHLELMGEETEVDKNIIEHISDPLMHLIRNSIDHGIEPPEARKARGKAQAGTISLEARNSGSDVLIIVKDDGKGLNKEKILSRAKDNNLLTIPEDEMNNNEIFKLILLPGFSTSDSISEYSGRGVGMDVVTKNIEQVGGSVFIDSTEGNGTTITLKIPLTLAIIDGMNVRVGSFCYTIPTISIWESFRAKESNIITDPDGNEMIMVRGQCYRIFRLHKHFDVKSGITEFTKGIFIMAEVEGKALCIFADELIGQQQVVVKALPGYIKNMKKTRGLAGCTILGDGSISLILDISGLASL